MVLVSRDLLHALIAPTPPSDSRAVLEEAILLAVSAEEYGTAHIFLLALEYLKPRQRWQMAAQLEGQYMGLSLREAVELATKEAQRYLGGRAYRRYVSPRFRNQLLAYLDTLTSLIPPEQLNRSRKAISKLTTAEIYLTERILSRAQKRWKNPKTVYQVLDSFLVGIGRSHFLGSKQKRKKSRC